MILIIALAMPSPLAFAAEALDSSPTDASGVVELEETLEITIPPESALKTDASQSDEISPIESSEILKTATPVISSSLHSNEAAEEKPAPVESDTSISAPQLAQSAAARTGRILITKVSYTGVGTQEFIELYNADTQPIDMTGWQLRTFKKTMKPNMVKKISNVILKPGEFYVIRGGTVVQSSEGDALFDFDNVAKNKNILEDNDAVELVDRDDKTIDLVGWGKAHKFESNPIKKPSSQNKNQVLQRCAINQLVGDSNDNRADFAAYETYELRQLVACVDEEEPAPSPDPPKPVNQCSGFQLNEIGANLEDQFIELVNTNNSTLDISGCKVMTNRSKKVFHVFDNLEVGPNDILAIKIKDTKLKLTKSRGEVFLLNSSGDEIDEVVYDGLGSKASLALIDGNWRQTYLPTIGQKNIFKEFPDCRSGYLRDAITQECRKVEIPKTPKICPAGQYLNPETNRCRKIEVAKKITPCKEGYYRSEQTGRCRSIAATAAKVLKPCRDDEFRNPATGRCKKIAAASDVLKECPEGFERNPATNRCRKIKSTSMPLAGFTPVQVQQVAGATWGWWVFGGVSLLALSIAGWQWRWEVTRFWRKIINIARKS